MALLGSLRDASSTLHAVPRGPVEPTLLRLSSSPSSLGRLFAPPALTADVCEVCAAKGFATPCDAVLVCSIIATDAESNYDESDLADLLHHTATHVSVDVVLTGPRLTTMDQPRASLPAAIAAARGKIKVSVRVPDDTPTRSVVKLEHVHIAGHRVSLSVGISVTLIRGGVHAPFTAENPSNSGSIMTPTIAPLSGAIFLPGALAAPVYSLSADGVPFALRGIDIAGLPRPSSLAFCSITEALLLADAYTSRNTIVAFDIGSGRILWETKPGEFNNLTGLAVLDGEDAERSVVFASSFNEHSLHAHRISDGTRIASVAGLPRVIYLAVEPLRELVYASFESGIAVFHWISASNAFEPAGRVDADAINTSNHPLAVVRDYEGGGPFLVVAKQGGSELRIYSIPGHGEKGLPAVRCALWDLADAFVDPCSSRSEPCIGHTHIWHVRGSRQQRSHRLRCHPAGHIQRRCACPSMAPPAALLIGLVL